LYNIQDANQDRFWYIRRG